MIEIIAEVGVNHNGDFKTAINLIDAAGAAGCDTVKFQTWKTKKVYPEERWEEMEALELSRDKLALCKEFCTQHGLRFLCTPDDYEDAVFLKRVGVERIKIGSSNVTNLPMIRAVAALGLPMIVSTGAATLHEARAAYFAAKKCGDLTLMHCVSAYPAPHDQMNLQMVRTLRKLYRMPVGFSDHSRSVGAALVALGLGATIFEKHLTLNSHAPGPDHAASLEPLQFKVYVDWLREAEQMLGDGYKRVMPCEEKNRREYDRFVKTQLGTDYNLNLYEGVVEC